MIFSAISTFSGWSRMTIVFNCSFACICLESSMVFNNASMSFAFALDKIECPDHQILILLLFLFGIGADDHHAWRDGLGEEAIAVEDEIQGLFERRVLDANGHRVISDILVENKVDPFGPSQSLRDFFQSGIAKPQCHRLLLPIITVQRLLLFRNFGDAL